MPLQSEELHLSLRSFDSEYTPFRHRKDLGTICDSVWRIFGWIPDFWFRQRLWDDKNMSTREIVLDVIIFSDRGNWIRSSIFWEHAETHPLTIVLWFVPTRDIWARP